MKELASKARSHCLTLSNFAVLVALIVACTNVGKKENQTLPLPNRIVLIFKKCPDNHRFDFYNGIYTVNPGYEIRYIDDNGLPQLLNPKLHKDYDTLVIETKRNIIEIQHAYKALDNLSFLFHNGDTVLFTYDSLKPTATVLNRDVDSVELNYDLIKRARLMHNDFPGLVKQNPIFALTDSNMAHLSYHEKFYLNGKNGREKALIEYKGEQHLLDSLKTQGHLSDSMYRFYQLKSLYDINTLQFPMRAFTKVNISTLDEQLPIEGIISKPILNKLLDPANDSLLEYSYYQNLLGNILYSYFGPKARLIVGSQSKHPYYPQVYDSVQECSWLSSNAKKILLYKTLCNIAETASVDEIQQYRDKFIAQVGDTSYINYVDKKYRLNTAISPELFVRELSGDTTSYDSLLNRNKGKLVYVDFWASWCAPCIRNLPASNQLREAYKNKDVVFVYLSIDEDFDKWAKGVKKHGLADNPNSYIISNKFTSRMLEALNIRSIPRYLLYDKNGKLVYKNAPRPGSKEIRKIFDTYLSGS